MFLLFFPDGYWGKPLSYDGVAGLSVLDYVIHWTDSRRYESSVWNAALSSPVSGIHRGARVIVSFPGVLGPMFGG